MELRHKSKESAIGEELRRKSDERKLEAKALSINASTKRDVEEERKRLLDTEVEEEEEKIVEKEALGMEFHRVQPVEVAHEEVVDLEKAEQQPVAAFNPMFRVISEKDKALARTDDRSLLINSLLKAKEKKEKAKKLRKEVEDLIAEDMEFVGANVLMPQYTYDERLKIHRETNIPPKEIFMPLGFDPEHDSLQKHYRKYYEDELENIKEVMSKSPFQEYSIYRGQCRGLSESVFFKDEYDEAGQVTNIQNVGKFKAIVTVENIEQYQAYQTVKESRISVLKGLLNSLHEKITGEPLNFDYNKLSTCEGREEFTAIMKRINCKDTGIKKHLVNMNYNEYLNRALLKTTKCVVRVYVISAFDLARRDNGSHSDPYLVLKMNDTKFNERENYILDEPNPTFYKHFDFEASFPGCTPLKLQVWDYDSIFGDDLIGETILDVEDRFFSPEWESIKDKPVEYRQLYHPSSKVSQGVVKMWLEIHPVALRREATKVWDINPRPPQEFEVRVVIWDTEDITVYDWEGTSDVYIRAFFDSTQDAKETDTHWRCKDGKASFNYRLKFRIKNPGSAGNLNIQIWDRDVFIANDYIGGSCLDLNTAIKDATETRRTINVNQKYFESVYKDNPEDMKLQFHDQDSFFVECLNSKGEAAGKVRVQIDIVPIDKAESSNVGEGRAEPNHSPYLPPPIGRLEWSFNPFKMLDQCVSKSIRNKILCAIFLVVCIVLCFAILPIVFGDIIGYFLNPANW